MKSSLFKEFVQFLREEKKWWMIPMLIVFALVGVLVVLAQGGMVLGMYPIF